jgi:hypothetical protein
MGAPQTKHNLNLEVKIGQEKLNSFSDRYFWDGKRFWQWNPSSRTFVDYRPADFKLHLRCDGVKNLEDRLEDIKRNCRIDVALPVALHPAGELIKKEGKVLLCTRNLELSQQQSPGDFALIRSALEGILGHHADTFTQWMVQAFRHLRGETTIRPPIICLVGPCPSGKGLIPRIANLTLIECWRPTVYQGRWRNTPVTETISSVLHLIDFSFFEPDKRTLAKLEQLIASEPEIEGLKLGQPRLFMARCHDCHWLKWEKPLAKLAENQTLLFKTTEEFSIKCRDRRMRRGKLIEKLKAEVPHFRHHLLTVS